MYAVPKLVIGIFLAFFPYTGLTQGIQIDSYGELKASPPHRPFSFSLNHVKVELSPRSASDNTLLHFLASQPDTCTLQILTLADEVLATKHLPIPLGFQSFNLSLYEIPTGWYWVSLTFPTEKGEESLFIPMLIER